MAFQILFSVQPFACLPNHVVGKGVIKTIRGLYPEANISPIDYDPGASEAKIKQIRIKLLMTVAKDNLVKQQKERKFLEKKSLLVFLPIKKGLKNKGRINKKGVIYEKVSLVIPMYYMKKK